MMKLSDLKKAPDYYELDEQVEVGGYYAPDAEEARILGVPAFTKKVGTHTVPKRVLAFGVEWEFGWEVWIDKALGIYSHTEYIPKGKPDLVLLKQAGIEQ